MANVNKFVYNKAQQYITVDVDLVITYLMMVYLVQPVCFKEY